MLNPNMPEPEFLKSLLEPLLEDFQYWFGRSRSLLETESIQFLGVEGQAQLLRRVQQAIEEVNTAKMLFQATGGQVGLEMEVLVTWHKLLTECWQVAMRFRAERSASPELGK